MSQTTERIHELVDKPGRYRHEYYNEDAPSASDAVYDHLYDELEHNALKRMEKRNQHYLKQLPYADGGLQGGQQP